MKPSRIEPQIRLVFIIHSAITEICAARIVELLNGKTQKNKAIFISTRRYRPFSRNAILYDWENLTKGKDSTYCERKPELVTYKEARKAASAIINRCRPERFHLFTPHIRLTCADVLLDNHLCAGYSIIEEGDLSYSATSVKKPFTGFASLYAWYNHVNHKTEDLLDLGASSSISVPLIYHLRSKRLKRWYSTIYLKPTYFYHVGTNAFEQEIAVRRIMLPATSQEEICCLLNISNNYSSSALKSIFLLPSQHITQFKVSSSDRELLRKAALKGKIIFRPHPDNIAPVDEQCKNHKIDRSLIAPESESLRYQPLEILVGSLSLDIINPGLSSTRRYTNLYNEER